MRTDIVRDPIEFRVIRRNAPSYVIKANCAHVNEGGDLQFFTAKNRYWIIASFARGQWDIFYPEDKEEK